MKRHRTKQIVHARFPGREMLDVPPGSFELAHRRTEYLYALAPHRTIAYLLACAWMQGVQDADQALSRPPEQTA